MQEEPAKAATPAKPTSQELRGRIWAQVQRMEADRAQPSAGGGLHQGTHGHGPASRLVRGHFEPSGREGMSDEPTPDEMACAAWFAAALARDTRGDCWHCGTPMTAKRQVGPCIYVEPVAAGWAKAASRMARAAVWRGSRIRWRARHDPCD